MFFSFQESGFKRDFDPWSWSQGKGLRIISDPLQREGQEERRIRRVRIMWLTPWRKASYKGTGG